MKNNDIFKKIVIANTFFWIVITAVIPNLLLLIASLTQQQYEQPLNLRFSLENFHQLFSPLYFKVYLNSIKISVFTAIICLIVGYPYAYIIYKEDRVYIKNILLIGILMPFWTSSLIRTYSIIFILQFNGILNKILVGFGILQRPVNILYSESAVIFGMVYTLIPLMIIPVYLSLRRINNDLVESAKDLGAHSFQIFFRVILPLSKSGITSGCFIVMLSSLGMFYLSDLLGGSKNILIGNLIKDQILLGGNYGIGAAISTIFYIFVLLGVLIQKENYKINFD